MPKLTFSKDVPKFRKSYQKTASGLKITKFDRRTNLRTADLLVRKNGTSRFTKYENGHVTYRVDMKPNQRDYYIARKTPNGTTKYVKTKEMEILNTFIEWCVRVFDETGNEIQQILKFQGLTKPACNKVPARKIGH